MANPHVSLLDPGQIIKRIYDETTNSFNTTNTGGVLVPEEYDNITLTYVASGNGAGEIETVTYTMGGSPVALLTLSYDSSNRLINVARS